LLHDYTWNIDHSGAVLAFTLVWIFWLLCALHFIIAAPIGKVCDLIVYQQLDTAIPVHWLAVAADATR